MKQKILFVWMLLLSVATVGFGQAPKQDRQERTGLASDKQTQRMQQRKKSPLRLPHTAGNAEMRRSTVLRAAQESKLLLDSVVTQMNPEYETEGNSKNAYVYNAAGKLILETENDDWDANTGQWESESQIGYDDRGNEILYMYLYDYESEPYGSKTEYAYDHLNWPILYERYSLQDGQWVGFYDGKGLTSFTDNADSYVKTLWQYYWDNDAWRPFEMHENTYSGQRQMFLPNDENEEVRYEDVEFPALPTAEKLFPANLLAEEIRREYDNDNGVFNYGWKREYTVVDGYIREYKDYSWNKNSKAMVYTGSIKYDYTFDAGLLNVAMRYYNSAENSDWVLDEYGSYTFSYTKDSNGNVLSWTRTRQSEAYASEKVEYTYDAQNRALTAIDSRYDYETQQFIKELSYERAFDADGNPILATRTHWNNDEWMFKRIYEYAYDAAGRQTMSSFIDQTKSEGDVSGYGGKFECEFDANGNLILEIYYDYDAATDAFIPSYKSECEFDANSNLILYIYYNDYDADTDTFIPNYKYEYEFDANGNRILEIYYDDYDAATQTFVSGSKYEYTFGDVPVDMFGEREYNPLTVKEYDWDGNDWVLEMDGKYVWTFDDAQNPLTVSMSAKAGNEWIWVGTMTWYYSLHNISGISAPAAVKDLHVWISNGELWMDNTAVKDGDTVQIFNIAGRKAIESKQRNGQSISVSHLPKGIYLVRVNGRTGKTIKN
jgi:hypothetical protein